MVFALNEQLICRDSVQRAAGNKADHPTSTPPPINALARGSGTGRFCNDGQLIMEMLAQLCDSPDSHLDTALLANFIKVSTTSMAVPWQKLLNQDHLLMTSFSTCIN